MLFFSSFLLQLAFASDPPAILTAIVGQVEVNGKSVRDDIGLALGSKIRTQKGRATLLIGREQAVQLGPNTNLEITQHLLGNEKTGEGEQTQLKLDDGKMRALVKNRGGLKTFQVKTKTATMGVRGTQIFVASSSGGGKDAFITIEGLALVTGNTPTAAPVEVRQGEAIVTAGKISAGSNLKVSSEQSSAFVQQVSTTPPEMRSLRDVSRFLRRAERMQRGELEIDPELASALDHANNAPPEQPKDPIDNFNPTFNMNWDRR